MEPQEPLQACSEKPLSLPFYIVCTPPRDFMARHIIRTGLALRFHSLQPPVLGLDRLQISWGHRTSFEFSGFAQSSPGKCWETVLSVSHS
jgi:hypothetical protein